MTIRQKIGEQDNLIHEQNISVLAKKKAISIIDKIKKFIKAGYHFDDDFEIAEKIEKSTENSCLSQNNL